MNGMNMSGKPGMVQPMQIPPTLGHPPMPRIQPRLVTLQLTTGPQQPTFTRHFGAAILEAEIILLVVGGTVAAFMHGLAEQPGGTELLIERNHGRQSGRLEEQVQHGLHEVVGLHRAAGNVDDGQPCLGAPIPAKVIGQAHGSGGIAGHGVNATVSSTGSSSHHGQGFGSEPINPLAGGDRLAGVGIGTLAAQYP